MASEMGLTQQDVTGSMLVSLSSTRQVSPNYWVNPENRVNYVWPCRRPSIGYTSIDTFAEHADHRGVKRLPRTPTKPPLTSALPVTATHGNAARRSDSTAAATA